MYRKYWLDGLNDMAWTSVPPRIQGSRRVEGAGFAEQAVALGPEFSVYWNTLGIAYFRALQWTSAIHALDRSMKLSDGGTSFDYYFLAMSCWHEGDKEQARRWHSRGDSWMEEHNPHHSDLLRIREIVQALFSNPIRSPRKL